MQDWAQISQWRKTKRAELIARRSGFDPEQRRRWNEVITEQLVQGFPELAGKIIGFCWPYKGEFDARFAIRQLRERGARAALPAVVERKGPLEFRKWWPGAATEPGVYGIPIPVGTGVMIPDAAIVPMNGFDEQGYRLGYGGGYFDRTLAALDPRPLSIGVSFEALRLPTIYPQPHDIPMNFVVTEATIYQVRKEGLAPVTVEECATVAPEKRAYYEA
jgi:5-formyltetrahydrofolate cyclo-ligase